MAYAGKSSQRLQLSKNYSGGESTLTSGSYRKDGEMGDSPKRLAGQTVSGSEKVRLYGQAQGKTGNSSLTGRMSGMGYNKYSGSDKVANVPSSKSAKGKTVRMKFEGGEDLPSGWKYKNTGSMPKALKGGKGY